MRFDIIRIIFMMVAITIANWISPMLSGVVGLGGGIVGIFIVGFLAYAIYCLVSASKIGLVDGAIFAVLLYIATMVSSMFMSGILGLFITSLVVSLIWGMIGQGKQEAPVKV